MNQRPVAFPLLFVQLLIAGVLLVALIGRMMEVWELHVLQDPDRENAGLQLSLRLWVPITVGIGVVFTLVTLLQSLQGNQRVGSNLLWPLIAVIFSYFAATYGMVIAAYSDGLFTIAKANLPDPSEENYAAMAYKAEVPAFYNLAPRWFPLSIGFVLSCIGFLAATASYFLSGNRGDLLEEEEDQSLLQEDSSAV